MAGPPTIQIGIANDRKPGTLPAIPDVGLTIVSVQNPDGTLSPKWEESGAVGAPGTDGTDAGLPYAFHANTAVGSDPGAGYFRLNNAALASVTAAAVADVTEDAQNVEAYLLAQDDSTSSVRGFFIIRQAADPSNFAIYSITGASTNSSGWVQLALAHVTSGGSFSTDDACLISFFRTGDKGDQGDPGADGNDGVDGATGPTGPAGPAVTLTAGAGLTGGGLLDADRTVNVAAADATITVNADSIQVGTIGNANLADNTIAPARLTNATAQYDFLMRVSSGAGAWERGARADLITAIDQQHIGTFLGVVALRVGASGGTYPTAGEIRLSHIANASGGHTNLLRCFLNDGTTEATLIHWNRLLNTFELGSSTSDATDIKAKTAGSVNISFNLVYEWTFTQTNLDATGGTLSALGGATFNSVSAMSAPADGARIWAEADALKGRTQNSTIATVIPEGSVNTATYFESYRLGPTSYADSTAFTVGQVALSTLSAGAVDEELFFVDCLVFNAATYSASTAYSDILAVTCAIKYDSSGPTYTLGRVRVSTVYAAWEDPPGTDQPAYLDVDLDVNSGNLRLRFQGTDDYAPGRVWAIMNVVKAG